MRSQFSAVRTKHATCNWCSVSTSSGTQVGTQPRQTPCHPLSQKGHAWLLWVPCPHPLCQAKDPSAASPGFGLGPTLSPARMRPGGELHWGPGGCVPPLSLVSTSLLASFSLQICFLHTGDSVAAITPACQFLLLHPQRGLIFFLHFP